MTLKDLIKPLQKNAVISIIIRKKENSLSVNTKYNYQYSYWHVFNGTAQMLIQLDEETAKMIGTMYRINTIFENTKDLEVVEINVQSYGNLQIVLEDKNG